MRSKEFGSALAAMEFCNVFNPYSDRCVEYDQDDAADRRRDALEQLLTRAMHTGVESLWVGRDLGYRGGRRTGLALTDEAHIRSHGERWDLNLERCTRGPAMSERTAGTIWSVLDRIDVTVFLWNVFPLHPHEAERPLSNRAHNARERTAGEEVLRTLIGMLKPARLVPIGKAAAASVGRFARRGEVVPMRHPSYGGQNEFREQARIAYRLS